MKRFLVFLFAVAFAGQAWAQTTFEIGNLKYTVTNTTKRYVSVGQGSTKPTGDLNIQAIVTNPANGKDYTVTSIEDNAFEFCNLTSVTIPNSVTSIGNSAFKYCSVLTSITIPNSVTSIGNYAFRTCMGLTSVTIPNSVTSIGTEAFHSCIGLTSVTIPNSVTSIGTYAFSNCSNLTSVIIPNSVTSISNNAFSHCSALTSVTIPGSVTSIGRDAFWHCSALTSITIPNSVTNISGGAFSGCEGLTKAEFASIESLCGIKFGSYTANPLVYAKHLYINGEEVTVADIPDGVKSIGDYTFYNCIGLTSVTIPNSVTSIEPYAFSGCSNLTEINVENDNTKYTSQDGVLFNKDKTTIVCYPAGKIGTYTIPNSVTSIGRAAFSGRSGLTSITIPNSVTSIEEYSFSNCSGLTSICYEGNSEPTYQSNSFNNVDESNPVYVPIDYAADNWCGFQVHKHNLVTISATPATCTETGLSEGRYCSDCDVVLIAQTIIPVLGHSYGTPTYEWTEDGKLCTATAVCQRDESHIATEEATATSEETVAATCEEMGTTTYTATFENELFATQTKDVVDIPATGHTPDIIAFENQMAATCTTVGSYDSVVYCSVCQEELFREEKEIPALGHTYINTVTNPTCTAVGYTTHTCSACNDTYNSDTVAAKGHKADSVEFENIVPATCTVAGSKDSVVFCSVCQVEISREERAIPALGHTEVVNEAVVPTCTKAGKTEGKYCSVCSAVIKLPIAIPATGHTADSVAFENVVAATCTVVGTKDSVVYCSVCQDELLREKKVIPAKGHTIVIDEAVEPTCTKTGLGEGKHCSVCNEYEWTQELIPLLGHDFGKYVYNNDATLEADGTETATCSRCGEKDTRVAEGTKLNATAVSDAAASTLNIYAHGNTIVVENATDEISVYNAMGTLIRRDVACRVRMVISVTAPGIYIVKTGNAVKRVMVN